MPDDRPLGRGLGGFRIADHASPVEPDLVPLSTRVLPDLKRRLKVTAAVHDLSVQDAVAQAVQAWVERHEKE